MTTERRYMLFGPWTGAALNPSTRRMWLKHRRIVRFIMLAIAAMVAGFIALCWLNSQPADCTDPHRVHAFEGVCR